MCSLQKPGLCQVAHKVKSNYSVGWAEGLKKIVGHKKVYDVVIYFVYLQTICKNIQNS